jgi:hypothetical protein
LKGVAASFYRAGLDGLAHAEEHLRRDTDLDNSQVILSLFFAIEMLMKAVHVENAKDIFRQKGQTISFGEALKPFKDLSHAPHMRILEEDRHSIQHFAQYAHRSRVDGHMESAINFAAELLQSHLRLDLAQERGVPAPKAVPTVLRGEAIDLSEELQRDAAFGGDVLAWAQARPKSDRLGVRVRRRNGEIHWLSSEDDFEYMPHTDGRLIAAYRQSGGVVVYDLDSGTRDVLSDTGGPGDVQDGIVAAQGLGIENGLGGGTWLIPVESGEPEQLEEQGDSPRISGNRVVWQSLDEDTLAIRIRDLTGGEVSTVERNAAGASLDGRLLAWNEWTGRPAVWVMDLETGDRIKVADAGIMPHVRGDLVAFLRHRDESHDVVVYDFKRREVVHDVEDVGFPTGRGPILSDKEVIWESGRDKGLNHLRFVPLP